MIQPIHGVPQWVSILFIEVTFAFAFTTAFISIIYPTQITVMNSTNVIQFSAIFTGFYKITYCNNGPFLDINYVCEIIL